MKILDFLQWLGVGGVALLSLYYSQKDNAKKTEQGLLDKMSAQLEKSDKRYDDLTKRLDELDKANIMLREDKLNLCHEKNQLIISKENMEKELVAKIENLIAENERLKLRIKELEVELEKHI